MRKQQGFTLIELVTVIVILGILAAFAVPRFINVTNEARAASINGLAGSVRSAKALSHAAYIVKGGTGSSVTMSDGTSVALSNGFPTPTSAGIVKALQDVSSYENDVGTNDITFWLQGDGGSAPADCKVVYTNDGSAAPSVTASDTCS